MATPRTPNQKKRYAALNKRLSKYVSLVQSVYDMLGLEAASIVRNMTNYSEQSNRPFRFKDYPQTKGRVNELMRFFSHDLQALIYSGTTEEWKQSNLVQDLLANDVLKAYGIRRGKEKFTHYYQPNNDALKAFQQRKDKGFTVSQKIWNQSYNFKREMEYAISSAIEKGQSAITLSKRISKYLHDFPKLQADYKERYGKATDCHNCEYRSIRLARSEINMAYRTAEQTRWQQMDFIKGYEIKLSHSHPKEDVCDELAGIYPKWFEWTGWHPNCFCFAIPIVMSDDEWYSGEGKELTTLPDNFILWARENNSRIKQSIENGKAPYWLSDNVEKVKEAAQPYLFDETAQEALVQKGYDIIEPKEYNTSAIAGFDLVKFDSDVEIICDSANMLIQNRFCTIFKNGNVEIGFDGISEHGEEFVLRRAFLREDGKVHIHHKLLEIPDEMQGIGIGKELFKAMIPQYLQMGADSIEIRANLSAGGYAWARYGFSAINRNEAEMAIMGSPADKGIKESAKNIIKRFYVGKNENEPFPMNLLASQEWGFKLLFGPKVEWYGTINLKDRNSVKYLKKYIGL